MKSEIHTFSGLAGLLEAGPAWSAAFAASSSDNPFSTWEWMVAWASEYAEDRCIRVLIAEEGGQAAAVAPLLVGRRRVTMLADPMFADYAELLLVGEAGARAVPALLQACLRLGSRFEVGPVRGGSPTAAALPAAADGLGLPWMNEILCPNPLVAPVGDFDAYMARRTKRLRQDVRTTVNHLERGGGWSFNVAQPGDPEEVVVDALVDFHLRRQGEKAGRSLLESEQNRRFFRRLPVRLRGSPVRPHLSAIIWQDRIVSAAYSLVCGQSFFYWIPSFDPSIRSVSLGKLHIACLMEDCFAKGLIFDFMGGDEPYKSQWAEGGHDDIKFTVFAGGTAKTLASLKAATMRAAKRAKRRSPALGSLWRSLSKTRLGGWPGGPSR